MAKSEALVKDVESLRTDASGTSKVPLLTSMRNEEPFPLRPQSIELPVQPEMELPDMIRAEHLPPRIRVMIACLLLYRDELCRYQTGMIELHFREASVQPKIRLDPPGTRRE